MSANHPLIGQAVRVTFDNSRIGRSGDTTVRLTFSVDAPSESYDGVVADVHSAGCFVILRTDDGSVGFRGAEYVRFTDPERAARMLRAHAADNEARSLGLKVEPEYTPPRWVPANDVEVGWPFLAAVDPDGEYIALEPSGKRLLSGDVAVFGSRDALVLIGEWPPLPQGKS